MEPWQWVVSLAVVVLTAVLIPVLLQARRTLRAVEELAAGTRPKLERALDEVTVATGRLNQAVATIERQAELVRPLIEGVADLGSSLKQARYFTGAITAIGAALGPALAAGLASFFGREEPTEEPADDTEPTPLRRPARSGGES